MLPVVLTLMATASAGLLDYASPEQPLVFQDEAPVFDAVSFDTGWWPGPNDPIAVRFHITPTGGVVSELWGQSELAWPDPMNHRVTGLPGGWFGVDAVIDMAAEVHIDIFGLFSGDVDLWSQKISLFGGQDVDDLLLTGGTEGVEVSIVDPSLIPPIEYKIPVIVGLELAMVVNMYPEMSAKLTGDRVVTEVEDSELIQTTSLGWQTFPVPDDQPGELGLLSRWAGELTSELSFIIEPEVELDTFLGTFQLLAFPIPVTLVDRVEPRESTPDLAIHDLPVLASMEEGYDFGEVEVGNLANIEVPLENLGELFLEARLEITGDGAFTVFPSTLAASPGQEGGVVVTFEPTTAQATEAALVIFSNDPGAPEVVISLTGNGFVEPTDPGAAGTDGDGGVGGRVSSEDIQGGCGCQSSPGGLSGLMVLALGLLVIRRRGARSRG